MKILSLATSFPRNVAFWYRIISTAKILQSSGYEIQIVYYVPKSLIIKTKEIENIGIPYSIIETPRIGIPFFHLITLLKGEYDYVLGNTHVGTSCALLGKIIGKPLIFDMHGGLTEEFLLINGKHFLNLPKYASLWIIDYITTHLSDKIFCVSEQMIDYLHNTKGIPLKKLIYVSHVVDLAFFCPQNDGKKNTSLKNAIGIRDQFVVGYIGNFQKYQGIEKIIETAKKIHDANIIFLLVGAEKEGRERNIIILPKVDQKNIVNYYSICDVLVLPRPKHPATDIAAPTKFAEYTAMGKPVLTTDVGDAAKLVKKYNCGIVINNSDIQEFIDGVVELKNKSNEELREMGNNARNLAETEYNIQKIHVKL